MRHALVTGSYIIALVMVVGLVAVGLRFVALFLHDVGEADAARQPDRDPVIGVDQVTPPERARWIHH